MAAAPLTKHKDGVRSKRKKTKKNEINLDQLSLHPLARTALDELIAEYAEIDTDRYTSRVTSEAEEGDGDLLEPDDGHLDDALQPISKSERIQRWFDNNILSEFTAAKMNRF